MMDWAKLVRAGLERSEKTGPAAHPDPDLLAAFVERTISEPEQRSVLSHLAACGTCRAVVYLSQPEVSAPVAVLAPEPAPAWRGWLAMRWVGAAAAVAVVAGTIFLYREQPQQRNMARVEQPTIVQPAAKTAAETPGTVNAPAAPDRLVAAPQNGVVTQNSSVAARDMHPPTAEPRREAATLQPSQPSGNKAAVAAPPPIVASAKPAQQPIVLTAQAPNLPTTASNLDSARIAVPSAREIKGPIPTTAEVEVVQPVGGMAFRASTGGAPVGAENGDSASPLVFEGPNSPPTLYGKGAKKSDRVFIVRRDSRGAPESSFATLAVPPAPKALASPGFMNANHTRWSTTGNGQLQRSGDAQLWVPVTVDSAVMFYAVAHGGEEVWAGGTGGALYHSHDDGDHWTKVAVVADGETLREDITSVTYHQPGIITVRTGSGGTWVSADGGLHWARHR